MRTSLFMNTRNINVTIPVFVMAAALLAGSCSKGPADGATSSRESNVIKPGVAIGPVHSGMTMQQVIAELGPPEQTNKSDSALKYTSLGLYVGPGKNELVQVLGAFPPFPGRTQEGIGIGSSRADIIQTYGEPTVATNLNPGLEVLGFKSLGINFELRDDKVESIGMIFGTA
jgi:hypothetical protein